MCSAMGAGLELNYKTLHIADKYQYSIFLTFISFFGINFIKTLRWEVFRTFVIKLNF